MGKELQRGLGLAVRERREKAKLSQKQLAEKAGVHNTYISQVESGQRNPSLDVIEGLAAALGTAPSVLLRQAEKRAGR